MVKSRQTRNLKIFFFWNRLLFLAKSTSQSVIFFLVIVDIFHALFCKWLFTAIVCCWWNGSYHSGRNWKHQDHTPSCTGRNNMKYHTLMIRLVFTMMESELEEHLQQFKRENCGECMETVISLRHRRYLTLVKSFYETLPKSLLWGPHLCSRIWVCTMFFLAPRTKINALARR